MNAAPTFRPIDAAAMDGKPHLVRDARGHLWCATWQNGAWFCGTHEIEPRITRYMARA